MMEKFVIPGHTPFKQGKVRDLYRVPDLTNPGNFRTDLALCVTTDRISAFNRVMGEIPGRGPILCAISNFWKGHFNEYTPNDLYKTETEEVLSYFGIKEVPENLRNRVSLIYLAKRLPFEFIIRGYLAGSLYREYEKRNFAEGYYLGHWLPKGMNEFQEFERPLLTPTTKSESGEDEDVSFSEVVEKIGRQTAESVRLASIAFYLMGHRYLLRRGIILVDTKFEFGLRNINGHECPCLIDEVLTPDSSRLWLSQSYSPGQRPVSLDKQYYRDWLTGIGWNESKSVPRISRTVQQNLLAKYEFVLASILSN
ncbi:MAG: phosphoribosylaminoimidazolesuccinocarboxamide synthase [Candidatus Paceibacterota bacterium]|jgi:phosphoribosylaminoimidazole-succinocarboxamide synthase